MTDGERYAVTLRKVRVDDAEMWRATVRELPDLAEFAETREEALDLALDAIESLRASAAEEGRTFPEPLEDEDEYSGRVTFRMSKSMHRAAAMRAMTEGVSLNSFIVECVALRTASSFSAQSGEENLFALTSVATGGLTPLDWSNVVGEAGTTIVAGHLWSDIDTQFAIGTAQLPWAREGKADEISERRRRS
jgi:predicted HicB family RNase H-like nuclease